MSWCKWWTKVTDRVRVARQQTNKWHRASRRYRTFWALSKQELPTCRVWWINCRMGERQISMSSSRATTRTRCRRHNQRIHCWRASTWIWEILRRSSTTWIWLNRRASWRAFWLRPRWTMLICSNTFLRTHPPPWPSWQTWANCKLFFKVKTSRNREKRSPRWR